MSEELNKEPVSTIKLRVIGCPEEIVNVDANEPNVHLTFRPSGKDLTKLVARCINLKIIHLPRSYIKTISTSFREYVLTLHGIELMEGDIWGHRSDIDVYATIEVKEK